MVGEIELVRLEGDRDGLDQKRGWRGVFCRCVFLVSSFFVVVPDFLLFFGGWIEKWPKKIVKSSKHNKVWLFFIQFG